MFHKTRTALGNDQVSGESLSRGARARWSLKGDGLNPGTVDRKSEA